MGVDKLLFVFLLTQQIHTLVADQTISFPFFAGSASPDRVNIVNDWLYFVPTFVTPPPRIPTQPSIAEPSSSVLLHNLNTKERKNIAIPHPQINIASLPASNGLYLFNSESVDFLNTTDQWTSFVFLQEPRRVVSTKIGLAVISFAIIRSENRSVYDDRYDLNVTFSTEGVVSDLLPWWSSTPTVVFATTGDQHLFVGIYNASSILYVYDLDNPENAPAIFTQPFSEGAIARVLNDYLIMIDGASVFILDMNRPKGYQWTDVTGSTSDVLNATFLLSYNEYLIHIKSNRLKTYNLLSNVWSTTYNLPFNPNQASMFGGRLVITTESQSNNQIHNTTIRVIDLCTSSTCPVPQQSTTGFSSIDNGIDTNSNNGSQSSDNNGSQSSDNNGSQSSNSTSNNTDEVVTDDLTSAAVLFKQISSLFTFSVLLFACI